MKGKMNVAESAMSRGDKKPNSYRLNPRFSMGAWAIKMALGVYLLPGNVPSSFAGYIINTQVQSAPGTNRYTWTVHNQDQSWGFDEFAIEVPAETRVLAYTVPPPYANPDGNAYWIMEEQRDAWLDPHDGRVVVPAPQAGR